MVRQVVVDRDGRGADNAYREQAPMPEASVSATVSRLRGSLLGLSHEGLDARDTVAGSIEDDIKADSTWEVNRFQGKG